jgi:hypothetical protein
VEFFLYRTIKYFVERFGAAHAIMQDPQKLYGFKMEEYMENAKKKALSHRVLPVRGVERKYEVFCKDKGRLRKGTDRVSQECTIRNDMCICSCNKPRLLQRPCTHVIAACMEAGDLRPHIYVPRYFLKETVWETWRGELNGFHILGSFTSNPGIHATYIPDPDPEMFQGLGRRKKKRIRGDMDRSEAGRDVILCSKCHEEGHTYKTCTAKTYVDNLTGRRVANEGASSSTRGRGRGYRRRGNNGGLI